VTRSVLADASFVDGGDFPKFLLSPAATGDVAAVVGQTGAGKWLSVGMLPMSELRSCTGATYLHDGTTCYDSLPVRVKWPCPRTSDKLAHDEQRFLGGYMYDLRESTPLPVEFTQRQTDYGWKWFSPRA